jgi:hypothetical protein
MTDVERERDAEAAAEALFRDMAEGAFDLADGPAAVSPSEAFPFGFGAGLARGLATAAAAGTLGFGAG